MSFKLKKFLKGKTSPSNITATAVIEAIHHEFNTASEKSLLEARAIIEKESIIPQEKADRLKKLGFYNTKEVKVASREAVAKIDSKNLIDTILYYASKYPQYKYITENDVITICGKYNLIRGDVSRYTGFVPAKNLSEIEAFSIEKEDKYTEGEYKDVLEYAHIYNHNSALVGEFVEPRLVNPRMVRKYVESEKPFEICASQKDMILSMYEEVDSTTMKIIPDPVVLQPVKKGGYLIVTAWGEEASDPLVENDI